MIYIIKRSGIGSHHTTEVEWYDEGIGIRKYVRICDTNGIRWMVGTPNNMGDFEPWESGFVHHLEQEYQSHILGMTSLGPDPDPLDAFLYGN